MDEISKYAELFRQLREEQDTQKNSSPNDHILIVDGLNTFIRVWSATPSLNDDGVHVGGIAGFLKSLAVLVRHYKPTRCIVVFDGKGGSSRKKGIYSEYKAGRKMSFNVNRAEHMKDVPADDESMKRQFIRLIQYLQLLPITVMAIDNVEADDVISYIATELYNKPDNKITIVSTDKDFFQLVDDRIQIWSPIRKKHIAPADILERFNIPAHNFLLYRTFKGDESDNIPGVNGVGDKTLPKLFPMVLTEQKVTINDIIQYCHERIQNDGKKVKKIYQTIIDSESSMNKFHDLMNLKAHDFSGTIKMAIQNIVQSEIPTLDKNSIRQMVAVDKMVTAVPTNFDYWISTSFDTLNAYALKTQQ